MSKEEVSDAIVAKVLKDTVEEGKDSLDLKQLKGEQSDSDSWEGKERKCSKVEVSAKLKKGLDLSGKDLKKALHILRKGNIKL